MSRLLSRFSKHLNKTSQDGPSQIRKPAFRTENLFTVSNQEYEDADTGMPTLMRQELIIKSVVELGNVSSNSTFVKRDLGFQGTLGNHIILTYGDTMFSNAARDDTFRGMTCNSVAIATTDPTEVLDPLLDENSYPKCLLRPSEQHGEDPSTFSLGVTNIIETSPGRGVLYFLLNHRPDFKDHLLGAGIAEISMSSSGNAPLPTAKRLCKFWWDGETDPWYGDVCALKANSYIYAYGHAKDNPWVYVARVRADNATDLNSYEYWNGETWQPERLHRADLNEKQSVFWQINQGQIYWSKYHGCFLFIYCDNFWSCQVLVKTASAPEGPWSEPVTVHKPKPVQEGGNVYAAVPHPYYDPSGKTLIITYTNHPNTIQAIQVEF